jgi:NADH-quinone oxidoreductase subunit A
MTTLVLFILIFLLIGCGFLFANMMVGKLVRPNKPSVAKGEIYECGEEAIGSAWVQFDLRFYVVALLFVIFDVEMAFFFPWAVVFGTSNRLQNEHLTTEARLELVRTLEPMATTAPDPAVAHRVAWFAFTELAVFFAILLIGFAYLWKRGDLDWVRSTAAQEKFPLHPNDQPVARLSV